MMELSFYNTLSRSIEAFQPLEAGKVRMYTCGPTVYNYAHIGNFRAYVFEDLLSRVLRFAGYDVRHIMNLTDVDDKTIRGTREQGVALKDYTRPFIDAFFQDLDTLGIRRADAYPAATDHIPEMIEMIRVLIDKGHAYQAGDGSVYYNINSFEKYGCLCRLDREGLRPGARVAQDEYEKESVGDFALWKAWDEDDGDVAWDSPWGRGRPGWHIECSAMSMKYLGETFDIHTGGVDNIFPHHDDEIAQSEAVSGKTFVNYWLHCAHLIVDGKKMSKSAGNFFTLRDLLGDGFSGRELRYELMGTHYRQQLNFTREGLAGARTALARLDAFRERLADAASGSEPGELPGWAKTGDEAFRRTLADDLNMSGAMGAVFDTLREGNKALDGGQVSPDAAAATLALWDRWDEVLGFLRPAGGGGIDPEVQTLVDQRQQARAEKNWAESDRLRDEIKARGYVVKDTPAGPKLTKAS